MRGVLCGVWIVLGVGGGIVGCENAPTDAIRFESGPELGLPTPVQVEAGIPVTLDSGRVMWMRPLRLHGGGGSVELVEEESTFRVAVTRRVDTEGKVEEFQYELWQVESGREELLVRSGKQGARFRQDTWLSWTECSGEHYWVRSTGRGHGVFDIALGHRRSENLRTRELTGLHAARLERDALYLKRELLAPSREFSAPVFSGTTGEDVLLLQEILNLPELVAGFAEAMAEAGVLGTAGGSGCPDWLKSAAALASLACKGAFLPGPLQGPAATMCVAGVGITVGCHLVEILLPFVEEVIPIPEEMHPSGPDEGGESGGQSHWIWL